MKRCIIIMVLFNFFFFLKGQDTIKIMAENAERENKHLFVVFGHDQCGWCRLMNSYHNDSTVNAILSKYFIITYINILNSEEGKELYKKYGTQGTPSWTIFNYGGEVVIDSDGGYGNVGYPAEESELAHYSYALKKTSVITEEESCLLVEKLKEYRNNKK